MDNICSKCGNTIPDGAAFCTECGTPASDNSKTRKKPFGIGKKNKKEEEKVEKVISPAPTTIEADIADSKSEEETASDDKIKETSTPKTPISDNVFREKPVEKISRPLKTIFFFFLMFIYNIPLIGILTAAIVSSSAKNDNIANYSKATFIWKIILLIICFVGLIVLLVLVKKAGLGIGEYINGIKDAVTAFVLKEAV